MRLPGLVEEFVTPLAALVYPRVCFACNRPVADEMTSRVCDTCWKGISPASAHQDVLHETRETLREHGQIDDLLSPYLFDGGGTLQTIIHQLKYSGVPSLGRELGGRIGRLAITAGLSPDATLLVPVPLHHVKLRERGYNQSDHICRGIAAATGIAVASTALRRVRYTVSQTTLTARERHQNVDDAFSLSRPDWRIPGVTVLLVDDVITTGATMCGCARVLRSAGAIRLIACSAAIAP